MEVGAGIAGVTLHLGPIQEAEIEVSPRPVGIAAEYGEETNLERDLIEKNLRYMRAHILQLILLIIICVTICSLCTYVPFFVSTAQCNGKTRKSPHKYFLQTQRKIEHWKTWRKAQ